MRAERLYELLSYRFGGHLGKAELTERFGGHYWETDRSPLVVAAMEAVVER